MHMYVSLFIFAYTSFLVVSMYCAYYSFVYVQPTCCPTRAPFWYKNCTKGDNRNQKQISMYSAQRIFADFAAGWGKYVMKLCTHVYTLSDWVTISHLFWAGKSLLDKAIVWGRYHKKQPDFSFTTYLRVLKRGGFLKDEHRQFCTLFLGCFLRYKII